MYGMVFEWFIEKEMYNEFENDIYYCWMQLYFFGNCIGMYDGVFVG